MGIRVLHDPAQGYAALYDSVTGLPLPIEIFSDYSFVDLFTGAEEMAERFTQDATLRFDGADLRTVEPDKLREYQSQWFKNHAPDQEWSIKHG